jgi:hypothetical protein
MSDDRSSAADKLDREGVEPTVESGAGYGDHAPAPEEESTEEDPDAD